jgi:hypothetical protein
VEAYAKAGVFSKAKLAARRDTWPTSIPEVFGYIAGYQARAGKFSEADATIENLPSNIENVSSKEARCEAYAWALRAWTED